MTYAEKHLMFFELLFLTLLISACSTNPQAINDRALARWAESGNAQIVSQLLSAGADVNAKGNSGATPLHTAACGDIGRLLNC